MLDHSCSPRFDRNLAIAAMFALSSACGGGGSSAPTSAPPPAPGTELRVTVVDPLGDPVQGLDVNLPSVSSTFTPRTNADGQVVFRASFQSDVTVAAWGDSDRIGVVSGSAVVTPHTDEVTVTVNPASQAGFAIASAGVDPPLISADGRTLEFSLGFLPADRYDEVAWDEYVSVRVQDCASTQALQCVTGATTGTGYRASDGSANPQAGAPLAVSTLQRQSRPYAVALLIDQSTRMAERDPTDIRVFATKYFMAFGGPADSLLFGAFATGAATTDPARLPQTPLSLFPIENPAFGAFDHALFATADELPVLEGGAAPLYAAIDRALDFTADRAPMQTPRAIVVLSSGDDAACTPDDAGCRDTRVALIAKARAYDVALVTLGVRGQADRALTALSLAGGITATGSPNEFGVLLRLACEWLGGSAGIGVARFRIEADTPGTFASGRAVNGDVRVSVCPWDCYEATVPFAVELP